jgi:hypothetical protein
MQFYEAPTIYGLEQAAAHEKTAKMLHSFKFVASVYYLNDALHPLHTMHALLQKSGLVLEDAQSYYLTARAHGERFLKDGCNLQTTPNLMQFVDEVRLAKWTSR